MYPRELEPWHHTPHPFPGAGAGGAQRRPRSEAAGLRGGRAGGFSEAAARGSEVGCLPLSARRRRPSRRARPAGPPLSEPELSSASSS
eukprot:14998415-Heterocapsa_arctica.AAC.1